MDKVIDMQGGVAKPPEKGAGKSQICVCACTYRRPEGLAALLEGLGEQRFSSLPPPKIHIVIADNEGSTQARQICERFRERSGIPLTYVHEPQRGISFARNACLDNVPAECEFFAFIDDDEVPELDWLERLAEAQQATGADVVQGPAVPAFCKEAPEWLVEGRFLGWPRRNWRGTRTQLEEHQELPEAYTNNVLVRKSSVSRVKLRFDPSFGLTGGEDAAFFRALRASGARIVYAPRAVVTETVLPERATLWYRLRLEYRIGISPLSANIKKSKTKKPLRRLRYALRDSGPGKMMWGLAGLPLAVLAGRTRMDRTTVCLLRIAFGAGQCARRLGLTYYIYR